MAFLLNWLWLGGVITAGSALLMRAIGPLGPRPRYRIWSAALVLTLLAPVVPALIDLMTVWLPRETAATGPVFVMSVPQASWMSSSILPVLWSLWAIAFTGRLIVGGMQLRRIRRDAQPFPVARAASLPLWNARARRRRHACLAISDRVPSAAVIGFRRALIVVSPRLLSRLSNSDLDRIIMHEWAHVQRFDDLAQLAQLAVRTIAGWHPAVWWIDRQISLERELACDEDVLRVSGSSREYASCLMNLAEITPARLHPLPAPGAIGHSRLSTRVVRLLALSAIAPWHRSNASARFSAALLIVLALGTGALTGVDVAAVAAAENWLPALPLGAATGSFPAEVERGLGDLVREPVAVVSVASRGAEQVATIPTPIQTRDTVRAPEPTTVPHVIATPAESTTSHEAPVAAEHHAEQAVTPDPSVSSPAAQEAAASDATLWGAAADAGTAIGAGSRDGGVAVGRGSRRGATATAGFFTRVGKKIAGSF